MRNFMPIAVAALVLVALTGCASPHQPIEATPSSVEPRVMTIDDAPDGVDRTAELAAVLGADAGLVLYVVEDQPGWLHVQTSIVDPRGDDGSAEAVRAVLICEAARALPGVSNVRVFEADGTHFAMYPQPWVESPYCGEV